MLLQPGHRVYWWHDGECTKATVDRIYKNRVRIKTADFAAVTVGLDEVELVPLVEKSLPPNNLPPNNLPPNKSGEQNLPPNNLPPSFSPDYSGERATAPPNSWIETKKIRGQIYKYARWREEVEVNGVKKLVKRSRYLEKKIDE